MRTRTIALTDDQRKYFLDVDNSILHQSVELGKAELQAEALKSSLGTLYAARMKHLNTVVSEAGVDMQTVGGVRVDGQSLVFQVNESDPPA